jgi:hypothetical protein
MRARALSGDFSITLDDPFVRSSDHLDPSLITFAVSSRPRRHRKIAHQYWTQVTLESSLLALARAEGLYAVRWEMGSRRFVSLRVPRAMCLFAVMMPLTQQEELRVVRTDNLPAGRRQHRRLLRFLDRVRSAPEPQQRLQ